MDSHSLGWALVLVLTAITVLGVVLSWVRRDPAVTTWTLGFGCCALGFLLLVMNERLPPLLAFVGGHALLLGFQVSLPLGLAFFLKVSKPWPLRYTLYWVIWLTGMVLWVVVWPSYQGRSILTSFFTMLLTVEFLVLAHRRGQSIHPLLGHALWVLSTAYLLVQGLRVGFLLATSSKDMWDDSLVTGISFLIVLIFAVLWSGFLMMLDAGRLQTQVRVQADELRRLNSLKDRILAMTSHDLRGPLGNLQMLWEDLSQRILKKDYSEINQELLTMVDRSLAGTQSLLENLFSFAEAQRARPDPRARTDLSQACAAVIDQWGPTAGSKGVRLQVESSESIVVLARFEAVVTVLRNLVGNAVKFTHPGGTVVLRTLAGAVPTIEVIDTGVGMDPGILDEEFDIDTRTSYPGTAGERGSGFGLVLVKELVAGWAGSLQIESAPGQGTRVRVGFPVRIRD